MISNLMLIIIMEFLFALTFPIGKIGISVSSPFVFIAFRMIIAGFLLLLYEFFIQQGISWYVYSKKTWITIIGIAVFYVYITFIAEFVALVHLSSLKSNFLWSFQPFISALLSFFVLKDRLNGWKWGGLFIGFFGMIPLLCFGTGNDMTNISWFYCSYAELLMLFAVISNAYGSLLVQKLVRQAISIPYINGISMLLGGIGAAVTAFLFSEQLMIQELYSSCMPFFLSLVALILISNIIGYSLQGYLFKFYSATFLSLAGFLCPLFGMIINCLFFHEPFYIHYFISLISILFGLLLFYREELSSSVSNNVS